MLKSNILEIYCHRLRKSNDDLLLDDNADDDLTLGTAWDIHNIVIPVKSVFDKNFSHYCYRVL